MIRVLVAEEASVVRQTLVALLGLEDDIEVAAGDQVAPAALAHRPDVALWISSCPASMASPPRNGWPLSCPAARC